MSVKRSRLMRSSSLGEIGVVSALSLPSPTDEPADLIRQQAWESPFKRPQITVGRSLQRRTRGIFTISSPVQEPQNVDEGGEGWERTDCDVFRKCCSCRQRIHPNVEVYMYRDFGSFCTPECREKQMSLDGIYILEVRKQPSKANVTSVRPAIPSLMKN